MKYKIPHGAMVLLYFIYRTETDYDPPHCYGTIYGHNEDKLGKHLTDYTLNEIEAAQASWTRRFGSSAAGAAQFMKNTLDAPNTLRDIEGEMGLTGDELFSGELQDQMAFHLLKRRGWDDFVAGKISKIEFGKNLAKEWASFPVLAPCRGAHRMLAAGQSYYAGDSLNHALTTPVQVLNVLKQVLEIERHQTISEAPVPAEKPKTAKVKKNVGLAAGLALIIAGLSTWATAAEHAVCSIGIFHWFCGG